MTDWPIKIHVHDAKGQVVLEIEGEYFYVRKGATISLSKPLLEIKYSVTKAEKVTEEDGDELPLAYKQDWISLESFRVMMDRPDVVNWLMVDRIPFIEPVARRGGMIRKVVAMRYVPEPYKSALQKEISEGATP